MRHALAFSLVAVFMWGALASVAAAGGPIITDLSMVETSPAQRPPVATRLAWPLCTETGAGFGYHVDPLTGKVAFHGGLDFAGTFGLAVHAAAPGRVIAAERRGPYGLLVEIDHGNGLATRYAHLQMIVPEPGTVVAAGQTIARVGSSGRSKGPHMHFEVWLGDRLYDPRALLEAAKVCPPDDAPERVLRGATAASDARAPVRFSWPLCARRVSGFGYRRSSTGRVAFHSGVDFVTDEGVPVRASATGRVLAAETRPLYGKMIEVDHGRAYRTRYGHLNALLVTPGEMVRRGQVVGTVGSTGVSTGPHLHFEIWYNDVVRDPLKRLEPDPACSQR